MYIIQGKISIQKKKETIQNQYFGKFLPKD